MCHFCHFIYTNMYKLIVKLSNYPSPLEPIIVADGLIETEIDVEDIDNFQDVLDNLNDLIEIFPDKPFAYQAKAIKKIEREMFEDAKKDLIIASKLGLNDDEYNCLLSCIFYGQKNYEEALEYINKSLLIKPYNTLFLSNRGSAYFKLENYSMAIKDLTQAIDLSSEVYYRAYGFRSQVYNKLAIIESDPALKKEYLQKAKSDGEKAGQLPPKPLYL